MQTLGYYLSLPLIYGISILPWSLLYLLSDLFYYLVFYAIGYRRKVVEQNLRNAFPHKNDQEIAQLSKAYYRYLCDLGLEMIKSLTMSKETALKHCYMNEKGLAIFDSYASKGQSILVVMGHWGNWEWSGSAFSLQGKQQLFALYHPLSNPYFDRLFYRMRTRFGTRLIDMKHTFRELIRNKDVVSATAFIADQTPSSVDAYWTVFLNQDTPVFRGTAILAKKLNYPVVYASVNRVKRGHYVISAEVLVEDPGTISEDEISELHTKRLEQDILSQPEIWLWSHRRWKHKRKHN